MSSINRICCLFVAIFVGGSCFCGCHKIAKVDKPADLIPYEQMVEITANSYIIESMVYFLPPDSDKVRISRNLYYHLYEEQKVTKDQFVSSVNYYVSEKKMADKFLRDVQENVTLKRDDFIKKTELSHDSIVENSRTMDTLSR